MKLNLLFTRWNRNKPHLQLTLELIQGSPDNLILMRPFTTAIQRILPLSLSLSGTFVGRILQSYNQHFQANVFEHLNFNRHLLISCVIYHSYGGQAKENVSQWTFAILNATLKCNHLFKLKLRLLLCDVEISCCHGYCLMTSCGYRRGHVLRESRDVSGHVVTASASVQLLHRH